MKKQVIISLETIKGFAKIAQVGSTYSANGVEFTVLNKQTSIETNGKGALITTSLSDEPMRYEALSKLVGLEWVKETRESIKVTRGKVLTPAELEKAKLNTLANFISISNKIATLTNTLRESVESYGLGAYCAYLVPSCPVLTPEVKEVLENGVNTFHDISNKVAIKNAEEQKALDAIKGKDKKEIANALHQITELTAQLTQAAIAGDMEEVQRLNALIQSLNS